MSSLGLSSVYDEEDELERQTTAKKQSVQASVPSAVAPPASPQVAASAAIPARPQAVEKAAQQGGDIARQAWSVMNPIHYKAGGPEDYTNIDIAPTAAHTAADLAAIYAAKKVIQGVGAGVSKRIEHAVAGVDPTISAQNQAMIRRAELNATSAISKGVPVAPVATPMGRVDPTFSDIDPPNTPPAAKAMSGIDRAIQLNNELNMQKAAKMNAAQDLVAATEQPAGMSSIEQRRIAKQAAAIDVARQQIAPVPPAQNVPAAPVATVTEAVSTGQSPNQAIQTSIAQAIDETSSVPEATAQPKGSVKPKGRPVGSRNLTAEQKAMIKTGEQVTGGRNWLVNQFGADPVAYEKYIAQYNKGQDYPDYKTAVSSLSENLEGPPKRAFKEAVKPPSNQGGFIDFSAPTLTPNAKAFVQGAKPVLVDTLKTGTAMAPFMLATDVRQQDVGFKRELQAQLKNEKDPARIQEIKNELNKLEEGRYLQAMYDRFVKKNVPEQYRPALTR